MTFATAQKRLLALGDEVLTMKFGLHNMRALMRELDSPHRQFLSIHVAGTNGKGSVCAFLDSVLRNAGYRVGLFTSPHLVSIRERIQVNGRMISPREFTRSYQRVFHAIQRLRKNRHLRTHPTYFETITAMGFEYFAHEKVDVAVVEVGMGGRLDSTNVIRPLVSAITNIDFDHERFLGTTIAEIAGEKAGIVKSRVPVLTAARRPEARRIIEKVARTRNSTLHNVLQDSRVSQVRLGPQGSRFVLGTPHANYPGIEIALAGRHQIENAVLAVRIVEEAGGRGLKVSNAALRTGLRDARWPGRFELLSRRPDIYVDGAHNPAGARALRQLIECQFPRRRVILVYGAMRDKAIRRVLAELLHVADVVILTQPKIRRAAAPGEIFGLMDEQQGPSYLTEGLSQALRHARILARDGSIILVTGSLYLVGEASKLLRNLPR